MLKLERLAKDPSRLSHLSNRHIVALCKLSTQVGPQGRSELGDGGQRSIVTSRVRIDLRLTLTPLSNAPRRGWC